MLFWGMDLICLIRKIRNAANSYGRKACGATAIEYALIAGGIALVISVAVFAFGDAVYDLLYSDLPTALDQ